MELGGVRTNPSPPTPILLATPSLPHTHAQITATNKFLPETVISTASVSVSPSKRRKCHFRGLKFQNFPDVPTSGSGPAFRAQNLFSNVSNAYS